MNVSVNQIRPRMAQDPGDADYMISISHISGAMWEIPVTNEELEKLQPWLPQDLRNKETD